MYPFHCLIGDVSLIRTREILNECQNLTRNRVFKILMSGRPLPILEDAGVVAIVDWDVIVLFQDFVR
jgi:hypothetical protein